MQQKMREYLEPETTEDRHGFVAIDAFAESSPEAAAIRSRLAPSPPSARQLCGSAAWRRQSRYDRIGANTRAA
jgi:hypothetical protein